jgi:uncharacterized protein (DUF2141 family)
MHLLFLILSSFLNADQTGVLTVKVANVKEFKGSIRMAVYNNEKFFLSETQVFCGAITPLAPETSPTLSCDKLPFGQYAVAVYHDLNNNNKMDKNALGIPTEPYAFSNNVGVKWRSPKFADAVFVLSNAKQELTISLKRWSEY